MLKSVYLSNDDIKVLRHLIIFFIIVFTFLMVIGNKYFIPKNKKQINNNIETFIPSFGKDKEKVCKSGYYCGHGGEVKFVGDHSWSQNNSSGTGGSGVFGAIGGGGAGGPGGAGGAGGAGGRKRHSNCNEEYEAQKKSGALCPTPCAPGQDQAWAAGSHESQIGANDKLLKKYSVNLGNCLKNFVNIGGFIS